MRQHKRKVGKETGNIQQIQLLACFFMVCTFYPYLFAFLLLWSLLLQRAPCGSHLLSFLPKQHWQNKYSHPMVLFRCQYLHEYLKTTHEKNLKMAFYKNVASIKLIFLIYISDERVFDSTKINYHQMIINCDSLNERLTFLA